MKLIKLQIKNFRSLKNLQVDLEEYVSIIVGKNNSGKTSLLLALERFLVSANPRFELDDFNIDFQKHLVELTENKVQPADPFPFCGVSLRLFIEYGSGDDLANVGNKVIMDLDPENRWIVLDFLYHLSPENLDILKRDYKAYRDKKGLKAKDALPYLRENHSRYFKLARRSIQFDHMTNTVQEDAYVDLIKERISVEDIISFKRINARRSVSNKDSDRSLSTMSAKIYSAMSADAGEEEVFDTFKEALSDTDLKLDGIYADLFKEVIADVQRFGGVREGDTQIQIKSTLQHRELLEENATVMYGQGVEGHVLPENYNGLGYLNLISIIFDIKIILNEFKRGKSPKPADINLLFIEEPEAHTHPQMQAIFIKNIKSLVGQVITNADGVTRPLQTILSTHSAHIVAESDFDDIKYFKRCDGETQSKNLRDLEILYKNVGRGGHYKFLKQYLTLHRSQLFFADKAILVEGDTERILLPAMMRKKDQQDAATAWETDTQPPVPLLSQNISVIEVGAYSQIFEIFLDFIGVKTLIITDLDAAIEVNRLDDSGQPRINQEGHPIKDLHAHAVENATHTTNYALQFFFGKGGELAYFRGLTIDQKTVRKNEASNSWEADPAGLVMCVYQVSEADAKGNEYHARSFEDAFFHVNRSFMQSASNDDGEAKTTKFPSLVLKYLKPYLEGGSSFEMAEKGISRKPSFAIEVLLNSQIITMEKQNPAGGSKKFVFEFNNWCTPQYIEEGLTWIKAG
ncbi:MAG: ATP-dependent endonuclease [Candidatus Accumulibacter sp.]|nr:ATP-dependent endonuclease [Accumulibacter sp.]